MTQKTTVKSLCDGPPSWTPPVSGLPIAYGQAVEILYVDGSGIGGWLEWANDCGGCLRMPKEHGGKLIGFSWPDVISLRWTAIREQDTR